MSVSDKNASDQKVKEQTNELRTKYPIFTVVLERIPVMDLKEVISVLVLVRSCKVSIEDSCYEIQFIGENKALDQMVEEKINELRTKYATLAGILERIHKINLKVPQQDC